MDRNLLDSSESWLLVTYPSEGKQNLHIFYLLSLVETVWSPDIDQKMWFYYPHNVEKGRPAKKYDNMSGGGGVIDTYL